jgi:hypothetical protein
MGISYKAILYVGKEFEDHSEAKSFYERCVTISEGDEANIDDDGFEEFVNSQTGLCASRLNYYNGYGFVLGIDIGNSLQQPEKFGDAVSCAISEWRELFKEEPFEIIHTVVVS